MTNMNRLAYTDFIFVSLVLYIRLANDIETNRGPAVVDNIDSSKTICAPDKSRGWFTFKFNTVKFAILDLRKHKYITNKNIL